MTITFQKSVLLSLVCGILLVLAACGAADSPKSEAQTAESITESQTAEATVKTLVVYFSGTGTTRAVAKKIAEFAGADLKEIVPAVPYTEADLDYNDENSRTSIETSDPDCRPEIAEEISLEGYDRVFVGYPIWWGDLPPILSTFVESHDFKEMTVIPFCTSGGSGIEQSQETIMSRSTGGNWKTGKRFGSGVADKELQSWLDSLN